MSQTIFSQIQQAPGPDFRMVAKSLALLTDGMLSKVITDTQTTQNIKTMSYNLDVTYKCYINFVLMLCVC